MKAFQFVLDIEKLDDGECPPSHEVVADHRCDGLPQDNVVIGTGISHYIYHIGRAFNLHSIINNGLVP